VRDRRLDLLEGREDSDILLMLRAWEAAANHNFRADFCDTVGVHGQAARRAGLLQRQLEQTACRQGLDCYENNPPPESIYRALLAGFSDHVAMRTGSGRCVMVGGRRGSLESDSVLGREHELFVALEVSEIGHGRGEVEMRLSGLTAIRREWLHELFGDEFGKKRLVRFDAVSRRVIAEQQLLFRDLVIEHSRVSDVTDDEATTVLAEEVLSGRIVLKRWDAKVEQWIRRVNLVAEHCPEFGVSAISDADRKSLLEQICHGARGAKELKNCEVWPVLREWLGYEQSEAVKIYAPERVQIENGRNPRVHYDDPGGPYIAMRVQELYDTHSTPAICNGKLRLKVRVLAPSQRPVQVTDDLENFWTNSYPQIKKDLRGRYPKHEWR
jgi:ATP-dependent helicase HrpB